MKRPDPVQHMMVWGAISSGIVLALYFLLTGVVNLPDFNPMVIVFIVAGMFTGFTMGGMAGVIIGAVFKHEQEAINSEKIQNRRLMILIGVFIMVLIVSRMLIIILTGIVDHPLALSIFGALIAALASQHYLYRMEQWLKQAKPKRKRKHAEILDLDTEQNSFEDETEQEQMEHHSKY